MEALSCAGLKAWLDDAARPRPKLLDVREPWEFEHCRIVGAQSLPMASVPARMQELDPEADTVLICHHGMRSMQVAMFLERQGFARLYNLTGGVAAWAAQVDPAMPTY
jgi:rhodanese-related sulfurtransferase